MVKLDEIERDYDNRDKKKDPKFNQTKYITNYIKEHYSRIEVRCKPEEKEKLTEKAQAAGLSVSKYLLKKGLED